MVISSRALSAEPGPEDVDQLLQLEVFVNDRPIGLVAAFTRRRDGKLSSAVTELDEVGLRVPAAIAKQNVEVSLDLLPGITYRYDEIKQ